jgi:hypothetical protein
VCKVDCAAASCFCAAPGTVVGFVNVIDAVSGD